jgi:hypothetical protein
MRFLTLSVLLLIAISIFSISCGSTSHKAGLLKRDTIMAEYITSPYGALQGGPAIRTIFYVEKVTTSDSITFKKSVVLDTTILVFPSVPTLDSATRKPKKDSLGNPVYHISPTTLPAKYVVEIGIPTH